MSVLISANLLDCFLLFSSLSRILAFLLLFNVYSTPSMIYEFPISCIPKFWLKGSIIHLWPAIPKGGSHLTFLPKLSLDISAHKHNSFGTSFTCQTKVGLKFVENENPKDLIFLIFHLSTNLKMHKKVLVDFVVMIEGVYVFSCYMICWSQISLYMNHIDPLTSNI